MVSDLLPFLSAVIVSAASSCYGLIMKISLKGGASKHMEGGLPAKFWHVPLLQLHGVSLTSPFFLSAYSLAFPAYLQSALLSVQSSLFIK